MIALQGIQQQAQLQGIGTSMQAMRRDVLLRTETLEINLVEKVDSFKQKMTDYFNDIESMLEPLFEESARAKWRAWAASVRTQRDTNATCAAFFSDPHKSHDLKGWLEGDLNGDVARLEKMVNLNLYQPMEDVEKKVRVLVTGRAFVAKDYFEARLSQYGAYCNPNYKGSLELFGIKYEAVAGHHCSMGEFQMDDHQLLSVLPQLSKYKLEKEVEQCTSGDDCDLTKQFNGCHAVRKLLGYGSHMSAALNGTQNGDFVRVSAATALVADQFLQLRAVMKKFREAQDKELLEMEEKAQREAAKQAELQQKDTSLKTFEETDNACRELDYCGRSDDKDKHRGDCRWEKLDGPENLSHTGEWTMQCKCSDFWDGPKCQNPTPKRHCSIKKYNPCTAHPIAWYQPSCTEHGKGFKKVDWEHCAGGFSGRYVCLWEYTCQSPSSTESYYECCERGKKDGA